MIKINERFSLNHDSFGWELYEHFAVVDRETGEEKQGTRITYPGRLWVALGRVIEKCGSEANDVKELRQIILETIIQFKIATTGSGDKDLERQKTTRIRKSSGLKRKSRKKSKENYLSVESDEE